MRRFLGSLLIAVLCMLCVGCGGTVTHIDNDGTVFLADAATIHTELNKALKKKLRIPELSKEGTNEENTGYRSQPTGDIPGVYMRCQAGSEQITGVSFLSSYSPAEASQAIETLQPYIDAALKVFASQPKEAAAALAQNLDFSKVTEDTRIYYTHAGLQYSAAVSSSMYIVAIVPTTQQDGVVIDSPETRKQAAKTNDELFYKSVILIEKLKTSIIDSFGSYANNLIGLADLQNLMDSAKNTANTAFTNVNSISVSGSSAYKDSCLAYIKNIYSLADDILQYSQTMDTSHLTNATKRMGDVSALVQDVANKRVQYLQDSGFTMEEIKTMEPTLDK